MNRSIILQLFFVCVFATSALYSMQANPAGVPVSCISRFFPSLRDIVDPNNHQRHVAYQQCFSALSKQGRREEKVNLMGPKEAPSGYSLYLPRGVYHDNAILFCEKERGVRCIEEGMADGVECPHEMPEVYFDVLKSLRELQKKKN